MIIAIRCKHCENIIKEAENNKESNGIIISFIDSVCDDCKKLIKKLEMGLIKEEKE